LHIHLVLEPVGDGLRIAHQQHVVRRLIGIDRARTRALPPQKRRFRFVGTVGIGANVLTVAALVLGGRLFAAQIE
jgi:hypothetical protein